MKVVVAPKNYYFKENLAYTEDHVVVSKIFAYNILYNTSRKEIFAFFSKFGEVKSVFVVTDKRKSYFAPKVGFIQFKEAVSAARVLKCRIRYLQKLHLTIRACDSWHQPSSLNSPPDDSKAIAEVETIHDDNEHDDNSFKLLMLNDDCLIQVFNKLPLSDQVRFAIACQRMSGFFEMFWKPRHENVKLSELSRMTLWEIRQFFSIVGNHIRLLSGTIPFKDRERIVDFIGEFCGKVETLRLNLTELRTSKWFSMMDNLQNCRVLELRACLLKDHIVSALQKMPNLQSLSLAKNHQITGEYIDRLTQIKELVLFGCVNMQPTWFYAIIRSLTELKTLDIRHCEELRTFSLCVMQKQLRKLETLKISWLVDSYESITSFPTLKNLVINSSWATKIDVCREIFEKLTGNEENQLETVKVIAKYRGDIQRYSYQRNP